MKMKSKKKKHKNKINNKKRTVQQKKTSYFSFLSFENIVIFNLKKLKVNM